MTKLCARILKYLPYRVICHITSDALFSYRGDEFSFARFPDLEQDLSVPIHWHPIFALPRPPCSIVYRSPLARRLFRLDIRKCLYLDDLGMLIFRGGESFWWQPWTQSVISLGRLPHGSGPLQQGCCRDDRGNCYYGEYWANHHRAPVRIFAWQPGMTQWQPYYEFPAGTVRHVHAVQFDPFTRTLWFATGDRDTECYIGFIENQRPRIVAQGSQSCRAVSLLFTRNYVYWGSDAGRDTRVTRNWLYRWSRQTGNVERLVPVSGPVYYSTVDSLGNLFITTAVEGSRSENRPFARLWMSSNGEEWQPIAEWQKDSLPPIFGYGVLFFPSTSQRPSPPVPTSLQLLYVVGQGVRPGPGTWILEIHR